MKLQPKIFLKETFVQSLSFKRKHSNEPYLETEVSISPFVNFDEEGKEYRVMFDGKFENSLFNLNLQFVAVFGTEEAIDEEFKTSELVKINSLAIAFPFMRSFISTFTINSGIPSFILPAYNFSKEE
ncbi:protein-export chaperone SecB [Capnocytophaga gingivalis]|jgi:preprotein translocase subunit secB|uniref:protein-export chaperone SecB n=1 Tax=Capnocytophaga gingivalis TaxID=1017 RepID=UPI00205E6B3D|nr:MAG TPA: Preprotein translocase subunit SecB [Caudoviricetes sp.]DAT18797.1 MAG TPA: Preprotein translocase subunit SecB [Bacteriophage sp.]